MTETTTQEAITRAERIKADLEKLTAEQFAYILGYIEGATGREEEKA